MTPGLLTTAERGIPLRVRPDLEFAAMSAELSAGWSVKDPVSLTFHRLEPEQYAVLQKLDGRRSLKQVQQAVAVEFPEVGFTLVELQQLIVDFHKKGLVLSDRPGQGPALDQRKKSERLKKFGQRLMSVLAIRLPGWNPMAFLDAALPWLRWCYHPATLTLAGLFIVSSWLLLLVNFGAVQRQLPSFQQFFGWPNLMWLWLTLGGCKVIHEFGHGLTCHYFGRRCYEMGVIILVFTPTLYCDASDSWLLPKRMPRIWIAAAGVLIETFLSAIAAYVWWFTSPGILNHLALNVMFVTAVSTVVFNLNPLVKYDGYHILSDWLGIPNLRAKAERLLDRSLARTVYGFDLTEDPLLPRHHQDLFVLYALASMAYGWFLFGTILLFLYSWLKPYDLQSVGIALGVSSLLGFLVSLGMRAWRIGKLPRHGKISVHKIIAFNVVLLALIAAVLLWPIPWFVSAAVIVEPRDVADVFNPRPGRILRQHVQPGERVRAGQLLLELENEELTDKVAALQRDLAQQEAARSAARVANDLEQWSVLDERVRSLSEQLREAASQVAQLRILAPVAGRVIAAEYRAPETAEARARLPQWHATPLSTQNVGGWLEERTHLLSLAPSDELQAVLYLPQAHRNEVAVGQTVWIKLDALPDRTFLGTAAELSHEQAETAPLELSNKSGGPLATESLPNRTERLQEIAYLAKVTVQDEEQVLRRGMRGWARFAAEEHSAGWWLWQTIRRTFRFRM